MTKLDKKNPQPLYLQVKQSLRTQISSGDLAPGAAIPDERTLAVDLGLSRMTVRRAIMDLTSEGLFERIPGRGTFVRDGAQIEATQTQPRRIGTIAIVAHFDAAEVRNSLFYYRILQGMLQSGHPNDAMVFRKITLPASKFAADLRQDASIDAVVILGVIDPEVLNALAGLSVPTVLVDSAQPSSRRFDEVSHASEETCFQAVSHLLQLGHRDIALMNFGDTPASRERRAGFERAMATRGLSIDPAFDHCVECNSPAAYAAGRRIVRAARVPTAVFCTTDELAIGMIAAAKDEGWKIPQQLSVIGYGDLGIFCMPALSTIRIPVEPMGEAAAKFLRERKIQPALPPRSSLASTEFIARATTDVPRD